MVLGSIRDRWWKWRQRRANTAMHRAAHRYEEAIAPSRERVSALAQQWQADTVQRKAQPSWNGPTTIIPQDRPVMTPAAEHRADVPHSTEWQ